MGNEIKPRHPATVRMTRIGPDGTPRPFSLAEQWKQVADWYAFLEADRASDYPVLAGMNEAWDELQPLYEVNGKCIVERGADLQRVSSSPLSALFYFVDMGFYPPPELLFALHDCWETYESAGGRTSLEQAFLGKTVQKSGNYAKRQNAKFQRMVMRWNFEKYIQDGLTRTQAAEIISEVWGGKPEPESILRMFRTKGTRERAKREK